MSNEVLSLTTKKLFAQALKNKIQKKSLSKITIQEITDDAGFKRRTFYHHFKDIYDLVEWIYQTELQDKLNENMDFPHWKDLLLTFFAYFYDNKEISRCIFKYLDRKKFEKFLFDAMNKMIMPVIQKEASNVMLSDEKGKWLSNFYALNFTALIVFWLEDDMKENPEYIIKNLSLVLEGSAKRVLGVQ